jgi:hypothetical protein
MMGFLRSEMFEIAPTTLFPLSLAKKGHKNVEISQNSQHIFSSFQ